MSIKYLAEYFHFLSSYVEDYDVAVNKINFKFAQTILRLSYLEKGSKRSSQKVTTQTNKYLCKKNLQYEQEFVATL